MPKKRKPIRKKPMRKKAIRSKRLSYPQALKKISRITGRPYKQLQVTYKGFPAEAKKVASSKSVARSNAAMSREIRVQRKMKSKGIFAPGVPERRRREIATKLVSNESFGVSRIKTEYVRQGQSFRGYSFKNLEAHRVPKGPRAGQFKFYYDHFNDRIITKKRARKLRTETRAERIAQHFTGVRLSKMRGLWKFFTPSELKRIRRRANKQPTLRELRLVGFRVASKWGPKLYEHWEKSFGFNYP